MDGNTSPKPSPKYNIAFAIEAYEDCIVEVRELLGDYHAELESSLPRLDPDWAQYEMMNNLGLMKVITVRDEVDLVGYACLFISPNRHCQDTLMGVADTLYLKPDYRRGVISIKFFKFIHKVMVNNEVDFIDVMVRPEHIYGEFLEYLGYSELETTYRKDLRNG